MSRRKYIRNNLFGPRYSQILILQAMKKEISPSKPLIQYGWLRVLLYIIAFGITAVITIGVYKVLKPISNLNTQILQSLNPGVVILLLFGLSLLITFVFQRWIDRKSFISLGFSMHGHFQDAITGGSLAIFIIGAASLILKATGYLKWMDIIFDSRAIFIAFGSIVLTAFAEELVFRGYMLSNLMDSFPKWLALLISALLFMIFHWTTIGFFPLFNTLILGLILGLNYIYTRNLWFSVCFHIGWKFMAGPALGFPGTVFSQTLLQTDLQGDEMITGGTAGLEGSVIFMAISLLSLIVLYLLYQKKLNPQSPPVPGRI